MQANDRKIEEKRQRVRQIWFDYKWSMAIWIFIQNFTILSFITIQKKIMKTLMFFRAETDGQSHA